MKIIGFAVGMLMTAPVFGAEPLSNEKQMLKLEDDWVRALVTHDRDVSDKIVAPGFTFIEPDGTVKNRLSIWPIAPATRPRPNHSKMISLK